MLPLPRFKIHSSRFTGHDSQFTLPFFTLPFFTLLFFTLHAEAGWVLPFYLYLTLKEFAKHEQER